MATPAVADSYYAYTQAGIPPGADIYTWCDTPPCDVAEVVNCATPEGGSSLNMNTNVWGGFGVFLLGELAKLSAFGTGDMKFFVQTDFDLKVEFQCRPAGSDVTYTTYLSQHGWDGTSNWQEITIPIADFFAPNPVDNLCLSAVNSPFMSTIENLPFFNTFSVDYVRWETANSHAGASTVQVQGRQFLVDGDPFVVNAMAYAPVGIGENWQSAWQDRSDRYSVDFPAIADSGANTVRLYAPILTTAMLDAAWAEGLHVIPTFGVDAVQLECAQGKTFMQDRFVDMVQQWKDHPAVLAWLIGNEVNVNLGNADLCIDWYPQLDALAQAGHTAEGAAFHPIGTATADNGGLADVCVVGCSDDPAMPNVDFWGAQIYRGCSFGTAFDDYANKTNCARPLVVTEFGADSYNRPGGAPGSEDQAMQANCIETLLAEADQALAVRTSGGVSSGQVVFEWTDEWWKAECEPTTSWLTQDTCPSFVNGGYPDPNQHEEWWGIATLDPADPNVRGLRTAHDKVTESWYLGAVCNVDVVSFDPISGNATISFDPAAGSSDHTLHYGPLSAVSSYGYTGSIGGLGATGSSNLTLPGGDLFWVVVGRNNGEEGCYGNDSASSERPPYGGASVPQAANRNCTCP
jgi:hypothetical protein